MIKSSTEQRPDKRIKLLYFYTSNSSFVAKDIRILFEEYDVKTFQFDLYRKRKLLLILIKQLFFLCYQSPGAKLVICQFAGLHAFLPVYFAKIFRKKSIIVAGGTDCVSFPSIHYGNFYNSRTAWLTAQSFRACSLILPVHESLVSYSYTYQDSDFKEQGLKHFVPGLKTPIRVLSNGYEPELWSREGLQKKERSFITSLGFINSRFTFYLKGIDLFIETARKFPDCDFTILGGIGFRIENLPSNLHLIPNLSGRELVECIAKHRYYLQLSMSEGFPNALSEAMLCECVPVVSRVGGMPDIVGELGHILNRRNKEELFKLLSYALSRTDQEETGKKCRERISTLYPFEKRKTGLLEICAELCQ